MRSQIKPCLWFDTEAEQAADYYVSIFPDSRIVSVSRYGEAGPREPDSVMVVEFDLDGQPVMALNGGPEHSFSEAISLMITCDDADELDHYWSRLTDGGEEGPCGWCKDRFGAVLAGGSLRHGRALLRPRPRPRPASDGGDDEDAQARPCSDPCRGGRRCRPVLKRQSRSRTSSIAGRVARCRPSLNICKLTTVSDVCTGPSTQPTR